MKIQLIGIVAIGLFTFLVSYAIWTALRYSVGIRLKRHHEHTGGDIAEVGMRAYNFS